MHKWFGSEISPTKIRFVSMGHVYIFLDEGGNFDFSATGTAWFTLTAVTKSRPFHSHADLTQLKYDLLEADKNIEYFHATEDKQAVRNKVFGIITKHLDNLKIDSVVVEKRKVGPALRPVDKFYPRMLGYLLRFVIQGISWQGISNVIVITDQLPVKKYRKAVEKATKITLSEMLPSAVKYRVLHHDSKSNFGLQIADYCNWAIYRKWDGDDKRSYTLIERAIRSEFEIFQWGRTYYY